MVIAISIKIQKFVIPIPPHLPLYEEKEKTFQKEHPELTLGVLFF